MSMTMSMSIGRFLPPTYPAFLRRAKCLQKDLTQALGNKIKLTPVQEALARIYGQSDLHEVQALYEEQEIAALRSPATDDLLAGRTTYSRERALEIVAKRDRRAIQFLQPLVDKDTDLEALVPPLCLFHSEEGYALAMRERAAARNAGVHGRAYSVHAPQRLRTFIVERGSLGALCNAIEAAHPKVWQRRAVSNDRAHLSDLLASLSRGFSAPEWMRVDEEILRERDQADDTWAHLTGTWDKFSTALVAVHHPLALMSGLIERVVFDLDRQMGGARGGVHRNRMPPLLVKELEDVSAETSWSRCARVTNLVLAGLPRDLELFRSMELTGHYPGDIGKHIAQVHVARGELKTFQSALDELQDLAEFDQIDALGAAFLDALQRYLETPGYERVYQLFDTKVYASSTWRLVDDAVLWPLLEPHLTPKPAMT